MTTEVGQRTLGAVPSDFLRFRKEPPHVIDNHGRIFDLGAISTKMQPERDFGSVDGGSFVATELNGPPTTLALGEPTDVSNARSFLIYPLPDGRSLYTTSPAGEYRIRVPYIRLLPNLSGTNSNWFTANAEEFIIYAAVSRGYYFNQDEDRGQIWLQRAAQEVQDVLARDKNESVSGVTTLNVSFDARGPRSPVGDGGMLRNR